MLEYTRLFPMCKSIWFLLCLVKFQWPGRRSKIHRVLKPNKQGHTTWPELVGMKAEDAEKKIKEEMSGAMVHVVPQDTFLTMEFRSNRVRLFVDSSQNVVRAPRIG
uniref:Uncharacterized protein n=1 Tax=Lactuca sativa TaxID=4236 RepID=A0A9R1XE26_LACSA|nr:hypothetical protein LSAT_V11C500285340 [Lactuca sativa]